jgi:hypothetical protein
MNKTYWIVAAAALVAPAACSYDRHESETPEQMTPASGYSPDQPAPNTTNEPAQPGSPEPMNKPIDTIPPEGTPTPDSRVTPPPGNTGTSALEARTVAAAEPAGGGNHGKGSTGKGGSGGSGGSSAGSAGR